MTKDFHFKFFRFSSVKDSLTYRQGVYLLKISVFNVLHLLFSMLKYHCSITHGRLGLSKVMWDTISDENYNTEQETISRKFLDFLVHWLFKVLIAML